MLIVFIESGHKLGIQYLCGKTRHCTICDVLLAASEYKEAPSQISISLVSNDTTLVNLYSEFKLKIFGVFDK